MFRLPHTLKLIRSAQAQAGFTMIELLIVISILGILAVAVLSAINPVEQINRGRDTGTQSDAEQLISAIDRHHAFQSYYPWQVDANDEDGLVALAGALTEVEAATPADSADCPVLDKLSIGSAGCSGTNELKATFITRIVSGGSNRTLFMYNRGTTGSSTYVCFIPQSDAYLTKAKERCTKALPGDIETDVATIICGGVVPGDTNVGTAASGSNYHYCLP
jgi:prepilin-type N-terminal cleavage/methylation domain-containing protein